MTLSGITSSNVDIDEGPKEWYFIASPLKVSWSKSSNTAEMLTYGTNSAYQVYGTTKLRNLNLSECLVEGFTDNKKIENNLRELEKCMEIHADSESGAVSPYCWKLYAGSKSYGTFLITNVESQEILRDNSGDATRAVVSVSLQEVAEYQVESGQDLASRAITGSFPQGFADELSELRKQEQAATAGPGGDDSGGGIEDTPTQGQAAQPTVDIGSDKTRINQAPESPKTPVVTS